MGTRKWRNKGPVGEKMDAHLAQLFREAELDMNHPAIVNTLGWRRFPRPKQVSQTVKEALKVWAAEYCNDQ